MSAAPKESASTMPEIPPPPSWQADAVSTEWAIARMICSLGVPAICGYARHRYMLRKKRKEQQEALLENWHKVQDQIAPAAEDQDDLRKVAEDARALGRENQGRLIGTGRRMASMESRLGMLEDTLVGIQVASDQRHTELVKLIVGNGNNKKENCP